MAWSATIIPCELKAWQAAPSQPGFPRVRGRSQGAVGTLSSSPALQPGPSGAERLSWSEGWATYGSGSNLSANYLLTAAPIYSGSSHRPPAHGGWGIHRLWPFKRVPAQLYMKK